MSEWAIYQSYCAYCATVGVTPATFERWVAIRWSMAFNYTPREGK